MPQSFLTPLLRNGAATWRLQNSRNSRLLASRVIGAFDSESRRTGLLGRTSLDESHAMIIAPTNAVHTCFMKFAIDIAFVTRDGRVVKTRASVKPWRLAAALRGYAVVEMPAGTLAECDTVRGDTLTLVAAAPEP